MDPPKRFFKPAGRPLGFATGSYLPRVSRSRDRVPGSHCRCGSQSASVELVGARTGLAVTPRRRPCQLGVEVLRGDLGLSHRIHCRIDDDDARIGSWLSVRPARRRFREGLAVNLNLFGTLGIFIGRVGPAQNLGARQQQLQVGKFWSPTGRLETCCWSKTVETSARSSSTPAAIRRLLRRIHCRRRPA